MVENWILGAKTSLNGGAKGYDASFGSSQAHSSLLDMKNKARV